MYPVLFEIGGLQITSFGVFMALSFLTAGWILSGELRRQGPRPPWPGTWCGTPLPPKHAPTGRTGSPGPA